MNRILTRPSLGARTGAPSSPESIFRTPGAHVGFLLMACLYHLFHFDLVTVNMHKVFIVLLYTVPALLVFTLTGNVHLPYGLSLASGMGFGAWWGARIAVKGGETIIRRILAVALIIMALRLLKVI